MTVPDLWQQQAVRALRDGHDVVVQAPTGSGKTLIFELWSNGGRCRSQAVYTVPTRALANDKRAEWQAQGWDVGIATGDLSENLSAPVLVATLETQKGRLIRGDGPSLLVVDEYQMLADQDRGLNYELALALAPPTTRLLLLSGSVANPHQIAEWLRRLGRTATVVRHDERPVPLEEVLIEDLGGRLPPDIRGYWPRACARALAADLGPILLFAPRRQQAELLAAEIARQLPPCPPLVLTDEQRSLVGDPLARWLKTRVAYHHSGLSYAARAGVVEPLAKAGQLRVVVATMGLAAGINFSLRSVAVTVASYRRDGIEIPLRPDEILQMFGRAGRRGIDEIGFVLVGSNEIRLRDAQAAHLARSGMVDWSALLTLMSAAADQGKNPFAEAVRVQSRLFTTKPIFLGVESAIQHPETPCGLGTDAERARHVRRHVRLMLNSRGQWQHLPRSTPAPLNQIQVLEPSPEHFSEPIQLSSATRDGMPTTRPDSTHPTTVIQSSTPDVAASLANTQNQTLAASAHPATPSPRSRSALTLPEALENIGTGTLVKLPNSGAPPRFGRSLIVADRVGTDRVQLTKWVRRRTQWQGRVTTLEAWHSQIAPKLGRHMAAVGFPVLQYDVHPHKISALVALDEQTQLANTDEHGVPLWNPPIREVFPPDCARCHLPDVCRSLHAGTGTALLWRRLELVDAGGKPTLRGEVVSYFQGGDGLAIAAALEDPDYPIAELVYDIANLDAGHRFAGDDNRWEGRLAMVCHARYKLQSIPGYLENGVPPKYGYGAHLVVASVHRDPHSRHRFVTPLLGTGDIDRILVEWRSLLRQIVHHPPLPWTRWTELQTLARTLLQETESPTQTDFPPLEPYQTRRIDHRLDLRKH